ncbi:MAG: hypothetical protein GF330_04665 [Candidatus Eisenbacteria bacterium]|nr:hypothetical protein [Candidatus Eisenbacteria bacterium]
MVSALWDPFIRDQTLIKLLVALVLGGLVGLERELKGRPAGLRTHVLVCVGSTILIIAARQSSAVFAGDAAAGQIVLDPTRLAAGIVTGIGFLGAGAILRIGDLVRGLTTGACIWFVAAVGIVVGNGLYPLAVMSTMLVLVMLELFGLIERRIPDVLYRALIVTVPTGEREVFEAWLRGHLAARKVRIQETLARVDAERDVTELTFRIRARGEFRTRGLIAEVSQRPEVREVEVEML